MTASKIPSATSRDSGLGASRRECPSFPPTHGTPIVFAGRRPIGSGTAGVRESGQGPDDPDGRPACWHHGRESECRTHAARLTRDRAARRLTSIGMDAIVWNHTRAALKTIPQQSFLERFEPTRRWMDGGTPSLGLARAAVLYHLPDGSDTLTPGERFLRSNLCSRICPSEVAWIDAQCRARFSYFRVLTTTRDGLVLRDWFGDLSGRRDVEVHPEEVEEREGLRLESGQSVFARLIPYRRRHFVDHLQSEKAADPADAVKGVWSAKRDLRNRTVMLEALFENWKRRNG